MRNVLGRYFWWTYERGSIHYDVMVTLILLFLFLGPRFIDFKDRPVETVALHSSEVLARELGQTDGNVRLLFQIRADAQDGPHPSQTDDERQDAMLRIIQPIAGDVELDHYEPVYDASHRVVAYNVWVVR